MPGDNNANNANSNSTPTKIITLDNLDTYTDYVERKGVDITYAAYQQLTPTEKQGKTFYITDYPDSVIDASKVDYDNTDSGLESDDVQDAIDELKDLIDQGGGGGTDTTYTLSVGTGTDANKVILTPSTGIPDKITVPYSTKAGDAETVNGNNVPVDFEGTTAQWNALTDTQKKSYDRAMITDDYELPDHMAASEITYNNSSSGISASNVQDAIDVVNAKVITSDATTSQHGLMSASDKTKLNGIATGATANTGTVTSVGITAGTGISVSGSPVTTSGSITVTNNGVRSISGGNKLGTFGVNTGGSNSYAGLTGLYFGSDEEIYPSDWDVYNTNDSARIHIYTTLPIDGRFYAGDKVVLFLFNEYENTTGEESNYQLQVRFNDSQTYYPVYYDIDSIVEFDRQKKVKMQPGKAYTLTFVTDLILGDRFIIDDLHISPDAFIGTSSEWSSQPASTKKLYDVAFITND